MKEYVYRLDTVSVLLNGLDRLVQNVGLVWKISIIIGYYE